ncbi:MAG: hypothetical protein ABI886_05885 [Betaproteobacteria bacterium]
MTSRRTFLVAGVAAGAALSLAWWLRGGRDAGSVPADGTDALSALDAQAPSIIAAIVPVMLDGALPAAAAQRAEAIRETVANVSSTVAGLPPSARNELSELFALLAFAPARLAVARVSAPWAQAERADVAAFLEHWRTSRFALLRSAYDALHQLVLAAWYANPKSWAAIGYPGPPALL